MLNLPKVYNLKMVFEEDFLILTVKARFQKNEYFKNMDSLILFFGQ